MSGDETNDRDRLRQALEAIGAALYDLDLARGTLWRDAAHRLFCSCRDESAAAASPLASWAAQVYPDDRSRVVDELARLFRERVPRWSSEYRVRLPDGSHAFVWDRGVATYDAGGNAARLVGTIFDISERERTRHALEASEERYRALVNAASQAVWVHDTATDTAGTEQSSQWWTDTTGQNVEQQGGWKWLEMVHPDDREEVRRQWAHCRTTGARYDVEYRIAVQEGGYRHFHVTGLPIRRPDGSIREWVGMFIDITERRLAEDALRRSEERFRAFMDHSPAVGWIVDTEGRMLYASAGFRETFKVPVANPIGKTCAELFSEEISTESLDIGRDVLRTGRPHQTVQRAIRADGSEGSFLVFRFPVPDPDGRSLVGGAAADITELKRLEDQLRHAHKMEAVGQLAGGVAHDFNNVLTIIQGYSDLVLSELEPDHPLTDSIVEIRKASTRAADLTRQLLAFSRKAVIRPVVLDLNTVIGEAENMLQRLIGEHIELATERDPELWRVKADPVQIDQILLNLAANARDAMPRGGRLTIATRNVDANGRHVELRVADTGCGMDADTKTKIFEPFFSTKGPDKGTGMGLAAVYGIVQQFGGRIDVESEPGRGATFVIHVPASFDRDIGDSLTQAAASAPRGRETVILVEDDPSVRSLTRDVLTRQGYAVLEAEDGPAAVRVSAEHSGQIHIVVTDVVMPGMSGLEVVQELRRSRPELKALLVSGYMDDALGPHGVLETDIELLLKPFSPATLAGKVREVLDR